MAFAFDLSPYNWSNYHHCAHFLRKGVKLPFDSLCVFHQWVNSFKVRCLRLHTVHALNSISHPWPMVLTCDSLQFSS